MAHWVWKPFLLLTAAGAIAGVVAFLQIPPPVSTRVTAAPAGIPKMQLLRDEHETMRAFLAEQAARMRMAAAVESEPGPDEATALAEAELEPAIPTIVAASKQTPTKPVRIVRASARSPLSILPPRPIAVAQMPPPPNAEPPRIAHAWVHAAARLPRRVWASVGDLFDERDPPIPPRPIPPV
jgi:hypothetical protein